MKACLVVEREWRNKHFGIRTVVRYFASNLKKRFGCDVEFVELSAGDEAFHGEDDMDRLSSASINFVLCPWIVSNLKTHIPNCFGVVIDIAPVLAHFGLLDIKCSQSIYDFHVQHVQGYSYYNTHCDRLLYISEELRWQYNWLYGSVSPAGDVLIPFDFSPQHVDERRIYDVGLVNVFDERKNFSRIFDVLSQVCDKNTSVVVAGEVRAPAVEKRLEEIAASAKLTRAFDAVEAIMRMSKVLFFPTHYEGLGLPILEAQQYGTPVITGRCGFIDQLNMCSDLVVDPNDPVIMATALKRVICEYDAYSVRVQEKFTSFSRLMVAQQDSAWENVYDRR